MILNRLLTCKVIPNHFYRSGISAIKFNKVTNFNIVRYASDKATNKLSKSVRRSQIKHLIELLGPEKSRMGGAIGLLLISSFVTMSVPFALGKVIDIIYKIDKSKNKEDQKIETELNLKRTCLALVGIFVIGGLCNMGRVYLMRISAQNITGRIRNLFYANLMKKNITFFDHNKTGNLINRLASDSQLVSQTITQQVSDGLRSGIMATAGISMMVFMSPKLALVGLSVVPPMAIWAVIMGRKVRAQSRVVQDNLANATQLAEERISNIRTVNTFGKQIQETLDYQKMMSKVLAVSAIEASIHSKFYGMTGFSGNMIIISVLYYGGTLVTQDLMSIGNLTSFILYAAYVGIGINGISTAYAETNKGLGASSRIFEIIDNTKDNILQGTIYPKLDLTQNIFMNDIHFRYPTRPDSKIFDGLNLTLPSKKITAIVGSSGSGKSSLSALLLRLYDAEQGNIRIGDIDLSTIDQKQFLQKIGTVTQEPILFSTSIRNNICYGFENPSEVSDEELYRVAKEANAHDFIMDFPDGYDTLVGERGVLLSGGQKQRVAIARAIIKNPDILILDEATSALDAASEHQVKEALNRVMKGRTVLTIAHRLSTIMHADKIVVLHDGKIVEEGTFNELNAIEDGYFKQLVNKQTIQSNEK